MEPTNALIRCLAPLCCLLLLSIGSVTPCLSDDNTIEPVDKELVAKAKEAISRSADTFVERAGMRGGFVYRVTVDGKQRFGEGVATPTEIWVQPPGTPTVGTALLRGYEAVGEPRLLEHATAAAEALVYGQLKSGGWTDRVDFDSKGKHSGPYRNGKGNAKGRNYSTLDDDKSQAAIRLLIEIDKAHDGKNQAIHTAVMDALESVLKAQFANGGFPQGWDKPVETFPVVRASFPDYDWRTEGRVKDYWNYETLNDGLAGTLTETLWLAYLAYDDERYRDSLLKFGDFLILAQMPEPQPAWAQQYSHALVPIWARKFEPAAIVGRESEDAILTLMFLTEKTGEQRFLKPIPAAIRWLKRSLLPDGQLARFYELETNKPLFMFRRGDVYTLTYDDSDLPTHYGFKSDPRIEKLEQRYETLAKGETPAATVSSLKSLRRDAKAIIAQLDREGRWVTNKDGEPVAESDQRSSSELYLDSKVFSKNVSRLAEYVAAATQPSLQRELAW